MLLGHPQETTKGLSIVSSGLLTVNVIVETLVLKTIFLGFMLGKFLFKPNASASLTFIRIDLSESIYNISSVAV